jgi:hypothetical protein
MPAKVPCSVALALLCFGASLARAQGGDTTLASLPLLAAPLRAAPPFTGPLLRGAAFTPAADEAAAVAQLRFAGLDDEALRGRRTRFALVGGMAGALAATVWYVNGARGNSAAQLYLASVFLPIAIGGGAVAGAVAGYGISFVVYPPRRAN